MSKLHIVGAGAIGSLVAAGAHRANMVCARYPRTLDNAPSIARWLDGTQFPLPPAQSSLEVLDEDDVLLLPLKVYQLSEALTEWLPFLKNKPTVVLLHNGMGGLEVAQQVLPLNYPLLLATTSHGAFKRQDENNNNVVVYSGAGTTQIGVPVSSAELDHTKGMDVLTPKLRKAIALLNNALPDVSYTPNILRALWHKLSVNAVINPLTALNNIQNKCIVYDQFSYLRHAVCQEFVDVASAYGFKFCAQDIHQNVIKVAKATGNNFSSMHQDVKLGRKTEISAINGYIVDMGTKKGIDVPVNALLVEKVNAL